MKNFYRENRVFSILMLIAVLCIVTIGVFLVLYFFNGQSTNKYGNRLEGMEKVKINNKKLDEYKDLISAENNVSSVDVNLHGKIIYASIIINKDAGVSDGVNAALKSLDFFKDEEKAYYDFSFIIDKAEKDESENYPVMGYKNAIAANIVWTKY